MEDCRTSVGQVLSPFLLFPVSLGLSIGFDFLVRRRRPKAFASIPAIFSHITCAGTALRCFDFSSLDPILLLPLQSSPSDVPSPAHFITSNTNPTQCLGSSLVKLLLLLLIILFSSQSILLRSILFL